MLRASCGDVEYSHVSKVLLAVLEGVCPWAGLTCAQWIFNGSKSALWMFNEGCALISGHFLSGRLKFALNLSVVSLGNTYVNRRSRWGLLDGRVFVYQDGDEIIRTSDRRCLICWKILFILSMCCFTSFCRQVCLYVIKHMLRLSLVM